MRDAGGRLTAALVLLAAFVIGGCDDSGPGAPTGPTSAPPVGGDPMPTSTAPRATGTTAPQEPLPAPVTPVPPVSDTAVPPPSPDQETTEPGSDEGGGT